MRPRALSRAVIPGVFVTAAAAIFAPAATQPAAAQPAARPAPAAAPPAGASVQPAAARPAARPAGAPDAPGAGAAAPSTPAIRDDVRRLHNEALAAFKRDDLLVAYEGFAKALAQQRIPRIAGNLGRTELRLGKHRDAAEHLTFFLREDGGLGDDERREVERLLAEAKAKVGTLRIEATPAGAEILVDGVLAGAAPLAGELYVEPGAHTVEARSGGATAQRSITARAGVEEPVLQLDAARLPEAPHAPPPADRPFPYWAVVLAGGAVAAVTGGALIGVALGQRSDAISIVPRDAEGKPLCAQAGSGHPDLAASATCDDVRARAASADALGNGGVALAVAGGVVAGAAIAWWLWPSRQNTGGSPSSALVPVAGPSGAAVLWRGTF